MPQFAAGVRFAVVPTLPAAASSAGLVFEQGGKLWFSNGTTWEDLGAAGAGGNTNWTGVTAGQTLADDVPLLATITTAQTFPIPASVTAGHAYILRNASTSTALASIDPGAGRQIQGCPVADTLTIAPGETAHLVARSTTFFELLTPGAVGPVGPTPTLVNETLRAMLENASHAMQNNPRTRGLRPASLAPAIAVGTGTVPGGFTRVYPIEAANSPFASGGGLPTNSGGVTSFPTCTPSGSTQVGRHWRVETILDGTSVAFLLDSATADGYRFIVDGQYVSASGTTSAAGGLRYYTLTFPTRGRYRIAVEGHTTLRFDEARVPDDSTLLPPERANPLRVIVVGDSNVEAFPLVLKGDGIAAVLGDQFGILDVWASGVFGTGFVATNGGANYTYAQRRTDWTTRSPDALLFCMSINDITAGATQAAVKAAVALELAQARAALPGVPIFVLGVVASEDFLSANSLLVLGGQHETGAQEAVNEANDPLIRMIPTINAAIDSPFTGTPGTGNWNLYVDGTTHATAAGQLYGGQWMAHRLVDAVANMAGLPTPAFAPPQSPVVAGGSPGGSPGQVQVNSAGSFGGAALTTVDAGGRIIHGSYFDQAATGIPAPPAAGFGRYFSRSRAGRVLPHYMGPAGVDVALQPSLFGNSVVMWLPGTGTTVGINFGEAWTARNAGTGAAQAHPTRASTNALTSLKRATFSTGTTATGSSGIQSTGTVCWRGNAAGLGGWFYFSRFAVETFRADIQLLMGLSALNAALAGEPSAQANSIGLCKDSADANWFLFSRDGSAVTKTATGLAVAAGTILDFMMFAAPNSSSVTCRLVNAVDGTVYVDNVTLTANLPVAATFLNAHAQIRSTTGTTAALLALNRIYVETDL
jgi:hypothetical protein